jgi:hypothetical protein
MKYTVILFNLLVSVIPPIYSQDSINLLAAQFSEPARPAEMIYLQTDKGIYETEEDLWFKAYVLDAKTHFLSIRNRTLYLQMFNEADDKIVWQEKYPIENGIASGHIYVDNSLLNGDYRIEAYTRHSFFADSSERTSIRRIKVLQNINMRKKVASPLRDKGFRFETFPEGGNLISCCPSKLAFKATDGHGYPIEIQGALYENDTVVTTFQSSHAGMGYIRFTPSIGNTYQIRLSNDSIYSLPKIYPQGMTLRYVGQDSTHIEFTVYQNEGQPKQKFYLAGQLRGTLSCVAEGILNQSAGMKIPLSAFSGQGIAVFTLYDNAIQPVAERLVYVHPQKRLYIAAKPEKESYMTREKVSVKIKVTDQNGKPVTAHLGVSVSDPLYRNPTDILTHCYLLSEIRGKIYDPVYYFNKENTNRHEAMDLLLLTQGWRRYIRQSNNSISHGQNPVFDDIIGVHSTKNKKFKNQQQFIKISNPEGKSLLVSTDSVGCFAVGDEIMKTFRGGYLYLKPLLSDEYKPILNIDDPFMTINQTMKMKEIVYSLSNPDTPKKKDAHRYIDPSIIELGEITVTGQTGMVCRDKHIGYLDSLVRMNLEPWVCEHGYLENYLPGFTHHHNPAYCPHAFTAKERNIPIEGKVYKLLKCKYYDNGTFIVTDPRSSIVYHGPQYTDEELLRINNMWRVKSYYGAREFYQPDEDEMLSAKPDFRNTLFWSSSVITDGNGEANITFYCSDINTEFTGQIEGIGDGGLLGSSIFNLRVLKMPPMKQE